jgi:hypothetical protein
MLAEERRVDEAENGGVGADAEAEDEDGGSREAPVADEAPTSHRRMSAAAVEFVLLLVVDGHD